MSFSIHKLQFNNTDLRLNLFLVVPVFAHLASTLLIITHSSRILITECFTTDTCDSSYNICSGGTRLYSFNPSPI